MDILAFLHNPNWIKLKVYAVLVGLCLICCAVSAILSRFQKQVQQRRAQDIALSGVGPAAFEEHLQAHVTWEGDLELKTPLRKRVLQWLKRRHRGRTAAMLLAGVLALMSLHHYVILSNWADGDQREFLGDHIGAVLIYKKALRVDPNLRRTHLLIGESLLAAGKINLSIKELERAAKDEMEEADPYAVLGDALRFAGRNPEALKYYRKAITMDATVAMYHVGAADCLERLGRLGEAETEYLSALRVDGTCLPAHQQYGLMLMNANRTEEGIAHFKKSLMVNPNNPHFHYNLATAYARVGFAAGAVAEYRRSIDLKPDYMLAHFNLGLTMMRLGDKRRATEEFQTCAQLDPQSPNDVEAKKNANSRLKELEKNG